MACEAANGDGPGRGPVAGRDRRCFRRRQEEWSGLDLLVWMGDEAKTHEAEAFPQVGQVMLLRYHLCILNVLVIVMANECGCPTIYIQ